jgi:hypothetical protein
MMISRSHALARQQLAIDLFFAKHKTMTARDKAFFDLLAGPHPLTPTEIDAMVDRYPDTWKRYEMFGSRAKKTVTRKTR